MLDIFSMDIDVATTMKKYFRTIYRISEITTTRICHILILEAKE